MWTGGYTFYDKTVAKCTNDHDGMPEFSFSLLARDISYAISFGMPGYFMCDFIWIATIFHMQFHLGCQDISYAISFGLPQYFICNFIWDARIWHTNFTDFLNFLNGLGVTGLRKPDYMHDNLRIYLHNSH
jgi:hypothetical protein